MRAAHNQLHFSTTRVFPPQMWIFLLNIITSVTLCLLFIRCINLMLPPNICWQKRPGKEARRKMKSRKWDVIVVNIFNMEIWLDLHGLQWTSMLARVTPHTDTHTVEAWCRVCVFFIFFEEEDFKEILTLLNIFLMFYFLHNLWMMCRLDQCVIMLAYYFSIQDFCNAIFQVPQFAWISCDFSTNMEALWRIRTENSESVS